MATREEIKSEVEKVPEERLEELYRVVRTFSREKNAGAKESFLMRLSRIQIEGPEDLSSSARLDSDGGDDLLLFAQRSLEGAYGEDEPEYSLSLIKEPNPEYEGR